MTNSALYMKHHDELYLINLSLTMYFMADDHYTHVAYSTGANFMVPFGLSRIEQLLTNMSMESFRRIGRKYIVNLDMIHSISTSKLTLTLFTNTGKLVALRLPKHILRELMEFLPGHTDI